MLKILCQSWVLVLVLAGCSRGPDHAPEFRSANTHLRQGNYGQAIRQYQQLERQGVRQPALFCNLGNAYYQSGRVGWSVYYYEKALALAPLDAQLIANIQAAQPHAPAPAAASQQWPALKPPGMWKAADAGAGIAVCSVLISSILYIIGAFAKGSAPLPKLLASSRLLLLVAALLLIVAGGVLWPLQQNAAIITLPKAALRSGPSSAARKIAEASEGEKVEVQASYGQWLKVQTAGGNQGWLTTLSAARLQN